MDRHLVIAGQGRAGSTLLHSMLRHTLKGFEIPPSEAQALNYLNMPGNICTKRPFDIFDIPKILQAAQGKKHVDLIITLRDPRDILTSFHKKVPNDYFYSADRSYFIPRNREPERTARGFIPVHKAIMIVATSGVFPQGVFLLKYEHLVADPERIKAKLADGLNLEFEGNFLDFHKQEIFEDHVSAMNGVRPVETTRQAKWKLPEHRARILDQFTKHPELHDILIALGYETDTTWFENLSKLR